MKIK
ncbi:chlorohydrolase [Streptococcus pneumoniae SPNA45]|jgi:putative addiction module killer protein/probable addiction module antidote protein